MAVCVLVAGPVMAAGPTVDLSREIATFQANGTLEKVVGALAAAGKVKISIDWDRLKSAGVGKETRAVVAGRDATLEQLLDLLVRSASEKDKPLGWYVDGATIRITTRAAVAERQPAKPATPARLVAAPTSPAPSAKPAAPAKTATPAAQAGNVEFKETPLKEVVQILRDKTNLNISVNWTALEDVGITKDSPVTIKVRNLTLGRVLNLILDDVSGTRDKFERLYYVIDDGVLRISTGHALNTTTKSVTHDIRDLLLIVPNCEAPVMKLTTNYQSDNKSNSNDAPFERNNNTNNRSGESTETMANQRLQLQETIIQIVKDSIGEDMWKPEGKGNVQFFQGRLIITQTPLGFKLMENAMK